MTPLETFFEPGSRVLTRGAFEFLLNLDVRRAMRSQDFVTLVMLESVREWEHMTFTDTDNVIQEVAQAVGQGLRDTDLLGRTDDTMLGILLTGCGFDQCSRVVERVVARIENSHFSKPLRVIIGAAGFPMHAMDAAALRRHAIGRPILDVRAGLPSGRLADFPDED